MEYGLSTHNFPTKENKIQDELEVERNENLLSYESDDSENSIIIVDCSSDSPKKKISIRDFEIINLLGKGAYAKVVLAKNIYNNKLYALKVIDKDFLRLVSKNKLIS